MKRRERSANRQALQRAYRNIQQLIEGAGLDLEVRVKCLKLLHEIWGERCAKGEIVLYGNLTGCYLKIRGSEGLEVEVAGGQCYRPQEIDGFLEGVMGVVREVRAEFDVGVRLVEVL